MDFEEYPALEFARFACIRLYFEVYFQGVTVGPSRLMLKHSFFVMYSVILALRKGVKANCQI